jgi:hypothetical protein
VSADGLATPAHLVPSDIQHCGSITQINLNAAVARNVGATRPGDIHAEATLSASIFTAKGLKNAPSV